MRHFRRVGLCFVLGFVGASFVCGGTASAQLAVTNILKDDITLHQLVDELRGKLGLTIIVNGKWDSTIDVDVNAISALNAVAVLNAEIEELGAIAEEKGGVIVIESKKDEAQQQYFYSKAPTGTKKRISYAKTDKDGKVIPGKKRLFGDIYFRPFLPKTRYYFDTGSDDEGEIDIFKNGAMTPAVDFINIFYPLNLNPEKYLGKYIGDDWLFGPSIGLGITSAASGIDKDGEEVNSTAPVVLLSAALELDIPIGKRDGNGDRNYIAIEVGYAHGISTDESLDNIDDGAIFVGLGYSWKQSKLEF